MNIQTHNNIHIRHQTHADAQADIWLLHGLGESNLCFKEAFEYLPNAPYNLYAPDYPGFGASPARKDCQNIAQLLPLLQSAISALSNNRPIHIIAHSMSGIIGTDLAHLKQLSNIKSLINIDGTILTPPEISERLQNLSPIDSAQQTIQTFYDFAKTSPAIMRYIASLNFADPETLANFARETYAYSGADKSGARYMALNIPKLYIYGNQSWSVDSVTFLKEQAQNTLGIDGGHWPMIDSAKECYQSILGFIENTEE